MIVAKELAVEGAYQGVCLEAGPGTLTAVAGPSGSGRTSLLLTLAGRMKPTGGTLAVAGHTRRGAIRKVVAPALVDGMTDLDRALTVHEHLRERRRKPYGQALETVGLAVAPGTRAGELDREQQVRLGLAMALLDEPRVIVADNVDAGLPRQARQAVWRLLQRLAARGTTVVASCVHPEGPCDHLVEL
ncbi:ABC transporter ATP-binding protein [Thermoactinospora rubra]|uniref:ABC transporter ATP-binding protein n=1 Tax=Thermoactinospora rubra TaxID=1088767 RepID=UPI001301F10A|nr:ATP-binding cassette domain-containing protein [Thermoactinospora rubra]